MTVLCDQRPSALLNYLQSTLRELRPEILPQHFFLQALPGHIQDGLAGSNFNNLESLGDRADEITSCPCRQALSISAISEDPPDNDGSNSPAVNHVFGQGTNSRQTPCPSALTLDQICYSTDIWSVQTPLHLVDRKQQPGPLLAPSVRAAGSTLLHVTDQHSGTSYLVESGMEVSILPCTNSCILPSSHSCSLSSPDIFAQNGTSIPTCGSTT